MKLTQEQYVAYYSARVPDFREGRVKQLLRCPFHDDSTASFSLDIEKGWYCHACKFGGGPVEFEMHWSNCDEQTAVMNVMDLLGEPGLFTGSREKPEAIYPYRDPANRTVLEKVRYPGKRFVQRKPTDDGKGWEYKLGEMRKPLYNLPEVITANYVIVCEGEKDADRVQGLDLAQYDPAGQCRVVATTNVDGAGKWNAKDAPLFAGKQVVILPDNDELGRKHAEMVAASVAAYAFSLKVVNLPGLPEKGDVSDFLETHSAQELLREIQKAPAWQSARKKLLVSAEEFDQAYSPEIDWLVTGAIQRGANGFICAAPKGGKSWLAADLAMALAVGRPWLGMRVEREVRVALISREDNPALTKWRLRQLARARGYDLSLLGDQLWVNSKDQSPQFRLDNPEHLSEMIAELLRVQPEFVILDVLNVLHVADENDNTEMRAVLEHLNTIHRETGASLSVLHHLNKSEKGSLTTRLRGSSAIAGWAEWLIGIEGEEDPRKVSFELKAASPPEPLYFRIRSDGQETTVEKLLEPPRAGKGRSRAEELVQ